MDPSQRRMLTVEDEVDILETARGFFKSEGCHVFTAGHGQEPLEMLEGQTHPDSVLMDLMMTVMNGEVFVSHKYQDPSTADIPPVIMSADHQTDQRANAIKVQRFISKLLSLHGLMSMAKDALSV